MFKGIIVSMPVEERIVVRSVSKPSENSIDELTFWFCRAFDLASSDESLEPALLKEIVSASTSGSGVTSKELNDKLEIPRTTVIYHLNRFIGSGIVVRKGRKYFLRSEDMESTIEELQADMMREFSKMLEFAERFDEILTGDAFGRGRGKEERKRREIGQRAGAGRGRKR
jgi:predicted transcriptional regulator